MAFVRNKRVGEHRYRQLVENYRDGAGRHRQRVLAHLGRHATVGDALEAARADLAALEDSKTLEQHKEAAREAAEWEAFLRREHGPALERYHGGEVPTPREVRKRTGTEAPAPETDEVESVSSFGFTFYKRAEVPIPPEMDEYCRAFGDGSAVPRDSPDYYGHTVFYPDVYRYVRRVEIFHSWRERAEKKGTEHDRRRRRLLERIEKLEGLEAAW